MPYLFRPAIPADIPKLCQLLDMYMQETYERAWRGTPQQLEQDCFGAELEMVVAETLEQEAIAFVAWKKAYDLHVCIKGGEVIDLFVCSEHRGRGIAINLLLAVASDIQKYGGVYIKGQPVNARSEGLYQRCARCFPGAECYVSGRVFRRLTELSGKGLRELFAGYRNNHGILNPKGLLINNYESYEIVKRSKLFSAQFRRFTSDTTG
ncbi:GNAT family N-acetyltransferase [Allocoleopsis sp.]|uniref:GNAT family N-acetyltransferase n=1 Tax=Allocoleopsis sp. TaxID=3088169 RepID=UPI002FD68F72